MILKKEYSNIVKYWLYLLLFLLIVIVAVGGLTRLTNSGLSITEWEVISGIFPPFNNKDWHESSDLYKKIPQYYLVNKNISLAEFKIILKNIRKKSLIKKIDKNLTKRIWKAIIKESIDYEFKNFKKKK